MRKRLLDPRIIAQNRLFGGQENRHFRCDAGSSVQQGLRGVQEGKEKGGFQITVNRYRAPNDYDAGYYAVRLTTAEVFEMFTSQYFLRGLWSAKI